MGKSRIPTYRLHKSSGQAVMTVAGRDIYLGVFGTPASQEKYQQRLAEHLAGGTLPEAASRQTVNELAVAYLKWAATWYVKNGKPTSQIVRIKQAVAKLTGLYGSTRASDFGPLALRAVRQAMIDADWTRGYVNSCVGCLKRVFKWGVAQEAIPAAVLQALQAVDGLKRGRTTARETAKVRPVPPADIPPVLVVVLPPVRAMIELQRLTGMRPGEVCGMRPVDVDRSGPVWVYRPSSHKTEHHDAERPIFLGPQAQAVLFPWLDRKADAFCFSPLEAMVERRRENGQRRRFGRKPGERYTSDTYAGAIRDGCDKAGVTRWHPHQLRHNAGTAVRAAAGPDVARAVLGQRTLQALSVYAELDFDAAAEVMRKIG